MNILIERIRRSRLVQGERGSYALILLLIFIVLALPMSLAVAQVASELGIASRVWDSRLTGYYNAGAGVEFATSEILFDSPAISNLTVGGSVTLMVPINGETVSVTVTKLIETKFVDVMLTLDSFGDVPVSDDDRLAGLKLAANTIVDTFELSALEGDARLGVTRFKNATNGSSCGNAQSIVEVTDVDVHTGDGDAPGDLHTYLHTDALHTHSPDPSTDEPIHDDPPNDGIDNLFLAGNDVDSGTNIYKGIKCGVEQFATGLGDRSDVPNIMIMITDGKDTLGNGPQDFMDIVATYLGQTCNDGIDNASDGSMDFADADCQNSEGPTPDTCGDGLDNDGDGDTDGNDTDCGQYEDGTPDSCTDGIDNGGDGLTDDADPDCAENEDGASNSFPLLHEVFAIGIGPEEEAGYPDPSTMNTCTDGIDNGGDGSTDDADPDCAASTSEDGAGPGTCSDGIDNGGDGSTDGADPDCADPTVEDNFPDIGPNTCFDGIDNDGDGSLDTQDHDCSQNLNSIAFNPDVPRPDANAFDTCSDGIDNGGDGLTDGADPDCPGNSVIEDGVVYDVYTWDHVFHAPDFDGLLDIIDAIVEAVKQAGAVFGEPFDIIAIAQDGTIESRVVSTPDDQLLILSWEEN